MHPYQESVKRIKRSSANNEFNDETSSSFWQSRAQLTLRNQLMKERNTNTAKNVIFFLGDGMSIPTLTAARIYLGQNHGGTGEESRLSFENFPYIGLSKVILYSPHTYSQLFSLNFMYSNFNGLFR